MKEAAAAGWYPDPDDDSSERWWGGTDWTANVRPLNRAPDLGDLLGELGDQLQQAARNPAGFSAPRQGGADTRVGALLVAGLPSHNRAGTRSRTRGGGFSSLFGLFIGLVFVWAGFNPPANMTTPSNMSATVVGLVASVQFGPAPNAKGTGAGCVPVVDFVVGGKPYNATASMHVSPCPWSIGQAATVAYDPDSPANAMVPTSDGLVQYLPRILGGIGALVALGFLFSFVRSVVQLGVGGATSTSDSTAKAAPR